jgi:hypothetical protein
VKYCRTPSAFGALPASKSKPGDDTESFFFAGTLKYRYLLLGGPNRVDLSKTVFDTQAHQLTVLQAVIPESVRLPRLSGLCLAGA